MVKIEFTNSNGGSVGCIDLKDEIHEIRTKKEEEKTI
jgi:hypothetical protein